MTFAEACYFCTIRSWQEYYHKLMVNHKLNENGVHSFSQISAACFRHVEWWNILFLSFISLINSLPASVITYRRAWPVGADATRKKPYCPHQPRTCTAKNFDMMKNCFTIDSTFVHCGDVLEAWGGIFSPSLRLSSPHQHNIVTTVFGSFLFLSETGMLPLSKKSGPLK